LNEGGVFDGTRVVGTDEHKQPGVFGLSLKRDYFAKGLEFGLEFVEQALGGFAVLGSSGANDDVGRAVRGDIRECESGGSADKVQDDIRLSHYSLLP
jgi:hypothetical protein